MLIFDFLKKLEHLPLSQGLDLVSYILNIDYNQAKLSYNKEIDDNIAEDIFLKLENHTPIPYITGRREFYSREFIIDESTLIPRVETEILVAEVIKRYKDKKNIHLMDICAGSGAVGLSLAKEMDISFLTLLDIDNNALNISKKNAEKLNITENIEYINADIFGYIPSRKYDIITCNPPYISKDEYKDLSEEVKKEPYHALVAKDDGLIFYKKILSNFKLLCKDNGMIFFEIGTSQFQPIKDYAITCNLHIKCIKDYAGHDRVVIIKESGSK